MRCSYSPFRLSRGRGWCSNADDLFRTNLSCNFPSQEQNMVQRLMRLVAVMVCLTAVASCGSKEESKPTVAGGSGAGGATTGASGAEPSGSKKPVTVAFVTNNPS